MSDEHNPYAPPSLIADGPARPPRRDGGSGGGTLAWQENGQVVIGKDGGELPDRCVVCNKPTDYKLKKTFMWHPPGYYLLVCAGWIVYLVVMLVVRKTATVELGLCDEHRSRRKNGLLIGWLGGGVSLLVMFLATNGKSSGLVLVSLGGLLLAVLVGAFMARVATPAKIDEAQVWLKAGEPFVASLPTSPEESEEPLARRPAKKRRRKAAED